MTRAEVKAAMTELDLVNGVEEGRLDVDVWEMIVPSQKAALRTT